ncbi:8148_t:CDS:2, partial [Cetraspora pellucida]
MTEIKIPFTKNRVEKVPASKMNPGSKGLELEITTNFYVGAGLGIDLTNASHGVTSDGPFQKMVFIFKDNAEANIYQALLDNSKTQFELKFEKEQVYLEMGGFDNFIDTTKPKIEVYPGDNSRLMAVFFQPKFAGIINLTATSQGPTGPNGPNIPTNDQQKIQQLEAKIAELEAKLRQQPDAPANEDDKKEIKRLQEELEELKKKNNPQQPSKDNFPYGLNMTSRLISQAKKNLRDYKIIDRWVAGLELTGNEIKSIRNNRVAIDEAYALPQQKELYVFNMNIATYQYSHACGLDKARDT